MKEEEVIKAISDLFKGADERNWMKIQHVLAEKVLLDYTSMSGGQPSLQTPEEITQAWAGFLPGFDNTKHQLSGFEVVINEQTASASYYGKADHYISNEVWTVEGTYNTQLKEQSGQWLITAQKFNLEKQSGNLSLPSIAIQNLAT